MWGPPSPFNFFNYIPPQMLGNGFQRPAMIPCGYHAYQSFAAPLFPTPIRQKSFYDDNWLLPRRSRITNNFFGRPKSRPRTRSYSARRPISQNKEQSFQIAYEIHDGFTFSEQRIVENALKIVANRLVKPQIRENMYEICGTSGYNLSNGAWSRSQLANHEHYHGPHDLLRYQLMCLKVRGEKDEFPTIHIHPIYEETDTLGRGTPGCVSFISHDSTFSTHGEFQVKLNRYHLDAPGKYGSDPVYWAGTIVHEMLHNLGHAHDDGDYTDSWQINVFEKCFIHNGNYSSQ